MKKSLALLIFFPMLLSAQSNDSDTLNLKASLTVSGFWQGGNVETFIFRARTDISFKPWKNTLLETKNSYVYQAFGKQKADEDILSLNFMHFNAEGKFSPLVLGFVSTNYRREIDVRYLTGIGARYDVFSKKKNWLKCALSFEYEHTEFKNDNFNLPEYDGNRVINTLRGTIWIHGKYYFLNDKLILTHESFFQPSLQDIDNYRWRADVGLEIPLKKFLSFKINYTDAFESVVIENQKRDDSFITAGFTIKNY